MIDYDNFALANKTISASRAIFLDNCSADPSGPLLLTLPP
jgi:hypothetical protein